VSAAHLSDPSCPILSGRALVRLGVLQARVQARYARRSAALRRLLASRHAATSLAQRDFWYEFAWADQEYRAAVHRLAQFCLEHREGSRRSLRSPWRAQA